MLAHCVPAVIPRPRGLRRLTRFAQLRGRRCSSAAEDNPLRTLLQLCVDRYFLCPGQTNVEQFQRGLSCSYAALGLELRRNLLDQWWRAVSASSAQVFGIRTPTCSRAPPTDGAAPLGIVDVGDLAQILLQKGLSREALVQQVRARLQASPLVRSSLYQGRVLPLRAAEGRRRFPPTHLRFVCRGLGAVCAVAGAGEQEAALWTG